MARDRVCDKWCGDGGTFWWVRSRRFDWSTQVNRNGLDPRKTSSQEFCTTYHFMTIPSRLSPYSPEY